MSDGMGTGTGEHVGRIVVRGTGRVRVAPDVAQLRLGVALARPTVALARSDAAAIQTAILGALAAVGVPPADVRTSDLGLHPRYDHSGGTPVPNGYELSNLVEVTVRDLGRLGEVIDGALAAGATSLDGLVFSLEDPGPAMTAARRAAVDAARDAATTLAESGGLALGHVLEIVEGGDMGSPRPFAAKAERLLAADLETPVAGGTTEVTATVTVTYAARPAG